MDPSLSTGLILGAVALAEGIRATPADALVMHRVLAGPWTRTEPLPLGRGFTLPSVAPFSVAIVAARRPLDGDPRAMVGVLRDRMAKAKVPIALLRVFGAASLAMLAIGVPLITARAGWFGLVASLAAVLLLSVVQAMMAYRALRQAAFARAALGASMRVLWPFTTPRSAEVVLDALASDMPPLVAARALMPDEEFGRAVRSLAYDLMHDREAADATMLRALCDPAELRAIVARAPDEDGWFCPRCGAGYAPRIGECRECEEVPLVAPTNAAGLL